MKRGNRKLKALDNMLMKTANNSRKIGEYVGQPLNRKERRAKEALERNDDQQRTNVQDD